MGDIAVAASMILIPLMFGVIVAALTDTGFRIARGKWLSLPSCAVIGVVSAVTFVVLSIVFAKTHTYKADESVKPYLGSGESVSVTNDNGTYFFDGPGSEGAVIFYPGAFVETEAYAKLTYMIAESGTDVFLVDMPFGFAPMGTEKARDIMSARSYDKWYMCGHSLDGATASVFCYFSGTKPNGMIFLASYSMGPMTEGIPVLSIYGSEDRVLALENYNMSRATFPEDFTEVVIEGGNHSGFGCYGPQAGDGEASISADEQMRVTVEAIKEFVG